MQGHISDTTSHVYATLLSFSLELPLYIKSSIVTDHLQKLHDIILIINQFLKK